MKTYLTLFICLILLHNANAQTWIPKGARVTGPSAYGYAGHAVAMPDVNTLGVAAPSDASGGIDSGHVRIYTWSGTAWVQKGSTLTGVNYRDEFGFDIEMPDANTVAVSARSNDDAFNNAGQTKVFMWNGTDWVQKGASINGLNSSFKLGYSVTMPDANTLAIGSPYDGTGASGAGSARVYTWSGTAWVLKGAVISGLAGDYAGFAISMPNANNIAVSAPFYDSVAFNAGAVRIYSWNGSAWIQKGANLLGDTAYESTAYSLDMADENTVVIGSVFGVVNSERKGKVKVYAWNGNTWVQKGTTLAGDSIDDSFGQSVSMPNANTLAVSASDGGPGEVKLFIWNSNTWVQVYNILRGVNNDALGYALTMPDANTLATGAPFGNDPGIGYGYVQVWELSGGTGCTNTSSNITTSACYGYISPSGKTYNTSGVYTDTIPNAAGCDSIITINVTVSNLTAIVDTTSSPIFVAQPANALSYVWKRCSDSVTVQTGAANTFTATENGTYFVTITDTLSCADASECFVVTEIVGIESISALDNISIYPNPATNLVYIRFAFSATYCITLKDVQSKIMYSSTVNADTQIDLSSYAKGIYVLDIATDNKTLQQKLVVK